jgi:hypothetical protein
MMVYKIVGCCLLELANSDTSEVLLEQTADGHEQEQ